MKRITGLIALLSVLSAPTVFAEVEDDEAALEIEIMRAEKKLTILRNMNMTEAERQAFWPVYEDYQRELHNINARSAGLIARFAREHSAMTNEAADQLLGDYLDIRESRIQLQESFLPRFKKVLPPIKVARYYQIENTLQAITDYDLAKEVPLIR
jgi:hypothetical protein